MKLYYAPGACSLSPHIVAREAGIAVDLQKVDLKTKTLADGGASYTAINGKGYVPALGLDDGSLLTDISGHFYDATSANNGNGLGFAPEPATISVWY